MKTRVLLLSVVLTMLMISTSFLTAQEGASTAKADRAFNATIIEACSCPMFCQSYFNTEPAAHHGGQEADHFCRFNNAFQVNEGHYGDVTLKGTEFWLAGDTGGDFTTGELDWAVLTFDPSVTSEQREGIQNILGKLYPVKWKSFTIAQDSEVDWHVTKDKAEAKLGGGKVAEMVLHRNPGMNDEPVVIKNLRYWGAPRHDGFVMMPNEVEAYRVGDKAFEFKGTNGFMITVDMKSADLE